MINPSVTSAEHTEHYVAMVLDEVISKLASHFERKYVEACVKSSGGNIGDSRYFLKKGCEATTLSCLPKLKLHKRRCCTINKASLDAATVQKLESGMYRIMISFQSNVTVTIQPPFTHSNEVYPHLKHWMCARQFN